MFSLARNTLMDTGDSRLKLSPLPESLIPNYRLFPVKVKFRRSSAGGV